MKKRFVLIVLTICVLMATTTGVAYAEPHEETPYIEDQRAQNNSKISEEVISLLARMNDNEELTIYVELQNFSEEDVMEIFYQKNPDLHDIYTETHYGDLEPSIEDIQSAIQEKRNIYMQLYENNNREIINEYCNEEEQVFVSRYTSLCILKLSKSCIKQMVEDDRVLFVSLFVLEECEDALAIANEVTRADYNRDTYNNTGDGVKIGQLESGMPETSNSDLDWNNVTCNPNTTNRTDHASRVSSIMVGQANGIAPDAELYCSAVATTSDYYSRVEWLLDQDVNVINMSFVFNNNGAYDTVCQWTDRIAVEQDVHVVAAAGNSGDKVGSPGMAYNVITVGGFDDNGTATHSGDTMYSNSAYNEASSYNRPEKPNILAPAEDISVIGYTRTGTSYAAPQVTAAIAQVIDYQSSLATKQTAMGAILLASAHIKVLSTNYGITGSTQISEKEGAGKLDARSARGIVYFGNYWSMTIDEDDFTYELTDYISSSNSQTRVAIFWLKRNSASGYVTFTDLDLKVYDPNGNQIGNSSTTSYSNYEIVEFDPTISGTYTIKIFRWGSSTSTKEHVGVAIY